MLAFGATPLNVRVKLGPLDAAPLAPIIPATWVPWPYWSEASWPGTKLSLNTTRESPPDADRSAFIATPLSITATPTPVPSHPKAHNGFAFTDCVVISRKLAVVRLGETDRKST